MASTNLTPDPKTIQIIPPSTGLSGRLRPMWPKLKKAVPWVVASSLPELAKEFIRWMFHGLWEDRVMGGTNRFLDENAKFLKPVAIFFLDHPFLLFTVIAGAVLIHAYWSTRPKNAKLKTGIPTVPAVDGEIYRVVAAAKHSVGEMVRQLYAIQNRLDAFKMDADVLVELYAVNSSGKRLFIRDFTGLVEIDGKIHPMIRQENFHAWEFSDREYEYCLNMASEPHGFDDSSKVPLVSALPSMPLELEDRKPIEGWVHFVVEDIDPQKLNDTNTTYKFAFVDSLGDEIPLVKASAVKRRGTVDLRWIR